MNATPKVSRCNTVGIMLVLAILALGLGIWLGKEYLQPTPPFQPAAATLIPNPKPLKPFQLKDTSGDKFDPDALRGRWTLLSFGYTHCPDICPTTLAMMDAVDQKLLGNSLSEDLDMAFVSVDPERDDLNHMREYLAFFNPSFRGATGDHPALHQLTDQIGVLYARADQVDTAMGYVVDHSASLVLLDPQVRLHALFSPPHAPDLIALDIEGILAKYPDKGND